MGSHPRVAEKLPCRFFDENKEASNRGDDTPISKRGIRLDALEGLFEWADKQRERVDRRASEHSWAYYHLDDPDDRIPPPTGYDHVPQDQTARDFVKHFCLPSTKNSASSMHAILQDEYIGAPTTFISYGWDSVLINAADGLIATLGEAATLRQVVLKGSYVWIDIVCHNQHSIGPVADQMRAVISQCDNVVVPMMSRWYERVWCIWEVLCAKLEAKPVQFIWAPKLSRSYKLAYRSYVDGFTSVRDAQATYQSDKEAILTLVESEFGTIEEADDYYRSIMGEVEKA
jgi:hypothetical protein